MTRRAAALLLLAAILSDCGAVDPYETTRSDRPAMISLWLPTRMGL